MSTKAKRLQNLGTYLYPITICVTLVAIISAIVHATTQFGKPADMGILIMNIMLAIVAIICIVYLWDKPLARYANMAYAVLWTTAAVLICL